MYNQSEADVGVTVYLRPTTRQAPAECYKRLPAVVVSYDQWPMVQVRIFDTVEGRLLTVHRDNIGLRRKTVKREHHGDGVGQEGTPPEPTRVLGRPVKPLSPESGYEEPMLF